MAVSIASCRSKLQGLPPRDLEDRFIVHTKQRLTPDVKQAEYRSLNKAERPSWIIQAGHSLQGRPAWPRWLPKRCTRRLLLERRACPPPLPPPVRRSVRPVPSPSGRPTARYYGATR